MSVQFSAPVVVACESLLHNGRLFVEYLTTNETQSLDVLGFLVSVVLICLHNLLEPSLDDDTSDLAYRIVCSLPAISLVVDLSIMRLFSFAVLIVALSALVNSCLVRPDIATVVLLATELHGGQLRSNMLRLSALLCLLISCLTTSVTYSQYLVVLCLEFTAWSTERYMLPWRLPASQGSCGGFFVRFMIGFVIGVHVCSGREPVLLRPPRSRKFLPETLEGFSIHDDRAYIRYKASPSGVLCAYLEGLGLVPFRMSVEDQRIINVYIVGVHAFRMDTTGWEESDSTTSYSCASRFPFRRLLLGVLLRTSVAPSHALEIFDEHA